MPKALTQDEIDQFKNEGYVLVQEAFPRDVAEHCLDDIWDAVDAERDKPDSWEGEGMVLQRCLEGHFPSQVMSQRYQNAIEDVVGEGRTSFANHMDIGYAILRFPVQAESWEGRGWHVDGNFFHHHVHSPEQGLIGCDLFTDIDPQGGGTAIRPGSHRTVAKLLAQHEPDGLPSEALGNAAREATREYPATEVRGRAGDALLMHPHLVHGSSTNLQPRVRIIANRCIGLKAPMNFNRPDGNYSPVESAVREAVINT